jgi:hypothetical protein
MKGRGGRDRMVVGFTTTYATSTYHHWCCGFESRSGRDVQHYVITFISDLRLVGSLRLLPPLKLKVALNTTKIHTQKSFVRGVSLTLCSHWYCKFESRPGRGVRHYVIKFVSDLRQVGGFLHVLRFPPPIKLTATI